MKTASLYQPAMEGMDLLFLHERGDRILTLEQVNGVGITSYIVTDTKVTRRPVKKYVRRVLRKSFFRKTTLVVPVNTTVEERKVLRCEVYTNKSAAFRDFEKAAPFVR
jgi:hypothetical protein